MPVRVMGRAMSMPTGEAIKGRLFNVTGDAIDGIAGGKVESAGPREIHQAAPKFDELSTSTEILFTGIKVIDLIEPYAKGVRLASSVVPVWARRSSSWSSSTTLPRVTTVCPCSLVWESAPVKETTSSVK